MPVGDKLELSSVAGAHRRKPIRRAGAAASPADAQNRSLLVSKFEASPNPTWPSTASTPSPPLPGSIPQRAWLQSIKWRCWIGAVGGPGDNSPRASRLRCHGRGHRRGEHSVRTGFLRRLESRSRAANLLDARGRLDVPDGSFDFVFSETSWSTSPISTRPSRAASFDGYSQLKLARISAAAWNCGRSTFTCRSSTGCPRIDCGSGRCFRTWRSESSHTG